MSSEDIKHTFVSTVLKHFLATTVKLNGPNYLLCEPRPFVFVDSQKKLKHLTEDPLAQSTTFYDDWVANDYSVMT